jgi:hypothetical protein
MSSDLRKDSIVIHPISSTSVGCLASEIDRSI